ncbi:TetR/AcrR family transcriptional regulator [Paractinoplanes deccanensis]
MITVSRATVLITVGHEEGGAFILRHMPRVSEQYRADRRAEIMAAAARLFATNGFHSTSMADIIGETGLSAGAVYRYFRSKEDLITAVAETALSAADEVFGSLLADDATPSPEEAMTAMIHVIAGRMAHHPDLGIDVTRVGLQVWAEALRSPQLATRADGVYKRLRGYFAEVARRWQAAGQLDAAAVPDQVGAAMLGVMQGFIVQRLLIEGTDPDDYLAGVKALLPTKP